MKFSIIVPTIVADCKSDLRMGRAESTSSLIVHRALRRRQRGARRVKCEERINDSGEIRFVLLVEGERKSSILKETVENDSATREAYGVLVTFLAR